MTPTPVFTGYKHPHEQTNYKLEPIQYSNFNPVEGHDILAEKAMEFFHPQNKEVYHLIIDTLNNDGFRRDPKSYIQNWNEKENETIFAFEFEFDDNLKNVSRVALNFFINQIRK